MKILAKVALTLQVAVLHYRAMADVEPPLPMTVQESVDRFANTVKYRYEGGIQLGFGAPSYQIGVLGLADQNDPKMNFVMITMMRKSARAEWVAVEFRRPIVLLDGTSTCISDPAYTIDRDAQTGRIIETVGFSLPETMLPMVLDVAHKAEFRVGEKEFSLSDSTRDALQAIAYRLRLKGVDAPSPKQQFENSPEATRLRTAVITAKSALQSACEAAIDTSHNRETYRSLTRRMNAISARLTPRLVGETRREYEQSLARVKSEIEDYDRTVLAENETVVARKKELDDAEWALKKAELSIPLPTFR